MSEQPVIWWVRRDLRLSDNPTLQKVLDAGGPVIPVFLCDEVLEGMGAAPKWRFGLGAVAFDKALREVGSRLIFRRGPAAKTLLALAEETEAGQVLWTRNYDPERREVDTDVKSALKDAGLQAESVAGHVLNEPWSVETGSGGFYKVYTPFWKAVRVRDFPEPISAPSKIPAPTSWPQSDDIDGWGLGDAMARGADVVRGHLCLGESAARGRLGAFIADGIGAYDKNRDRLDLDGTSGLSEPLAYGEIGIRTCWHAGARAMADGKPGAETFLKELIWRDFATHLVFHTPHITSGNWRPEWDAFPWNEDERLAEVRAWKRGRTGVRVVDAAMRELYVSGRMHNRTRMLVASYLTKHLMCHWKIGLNWFADCLVDWDPASNAMGWQWSAGSGPDATPYFRVFNAETQAEKFDPAETYRRRWLAEGQGDPGAEALSFFDAIPSSWGMAQGDGYPSQPIVSMSAGRDRALAAYKNRDF